MEESPEGAPFALPADARLAVRLWQMMRRCSFLRDGMCVRSMASMMRPNTTTT